MIAFVLRRLLQAVARHAGGRASSRSRCSTSSATRSSLMLAQDATPADRARMRAATRPRPAVLRAVRQLRRQRACRASSASRCASGRPVSALLVERLPATLELVVLRGAAGAAVGIPIGVYTALRRDSWLARAAQALSLVGVSLPTFLIGILLILIFSVRLGWLPSFGRGDTVALGWWTTGFLTASGLKALILPSITLGLFQLTLIMRLVRAEMLEVLRTDYIKFARARGLTDRAVNFGHALKNTLVPVITITGLQLGAIIAFAIITETVFQWPGMGLLFIQAVQLRRHPGDGGLPVPDRALLRGRSTWSSTCSTTSSIRACGSSGERGAMSRRVALATATRVALRASCDSDLAYSFRRSPVTIVAAALTLLCVGARRCSRPGSRRTTRSTSPRSTCSTRSRRRPGCEGGDARVPARHRQPGPRRAVDDPLRRAHLARRRPRRGRCSRWCSASTLGLVAATSAARVDALHHAHRRRPAVLPGDPDRAADRRRGARRAAAPSCTTRSRSPC